VHGFDDGRMTYDVSECLSLEFSLFGVYQIEDSCLWILTQLLLKLTRDAKVPFCRFLFHSHTSFS
jgi:hypothetical protein